MRASLLRILFGILIAASFCGGELRAAIVSGTIESVSAEDRSVTVMVARKDQPQTFVIKANAIVTLDGKTAPLDKLEAGQTVSITTSTGNEATKLAARSSTDAKAEPKTATPKPKKEVEKKPVKKPAKKVLLDENGNPIPQENGIGAGTNDGVMEDDGTFPKVASKTKSTETGGVSKKKGGKNEPKEHKEIVVGEWPQFRGPNRDNISREAGLLSRWPEEGPKLAWKATGLGAGYSSVAVVKGKVYTMGNRNDDEYLIALDAGSGEELWALKIGKAFHNDQGDGPRGTPTVDEDHVYALGANGDLVCAGAEKGDLIWDINILKQFDANNIGWGISESVLVDGDHVICTPGGRKATIAALNKHNGKPVWRSQVQGHPAAAYSSMIAIDVGKTRQYVNFVHTGVVGVSAKDGKPLWGDQASANGTANCSAPIFYDDGIFSASGYGKGGAYVKLAAAGAQTKATLAYHTPNMKNHHGGMAAVSGFLYGFDEGTLVCLEIKSGKVKWQDRSVGKGSLTIADGMLYLRGENGQLGLAEVTQDGYLESGRFDQPDRSNKPAWAHPAIAGGKLYLRDMDTLLVYDVRAE